MIFPHAKKGELKKMTEINAGIKMDFGELNEKIRESTDREISIKGCTGQRYIASGLSGKKIEIDGIPGNALGSYLDGSSITVRGNVQDATGDTMNCGEIVIHGNAGDATGYAMRGGSIYIKGNTGYRAGIHMKAYKEQQPALIIGGEAGSFLGEYQAGGIIAVLDIEQKAERRGNGTFIATGMHGGKIYMRLRTGAKVPEVPPYVKLTLGHGKDLAEIRPYLEKFCSYFGDVNLDSLIESDYAVLEPNKDHPYKQTYCLN